VPTGEVPAAKKTLLRIQASTEYYILWKRVYPAGKCYSHWIPQNIPCVSTVGLCAKPGFWSTES